MLATFDRRRQLCTTGQNVLTAPVTHHWENDWGQLVHASPTMRGMVSFAAARSLRLFWRYTFFSTRVIFDQVRAHAMHAARDTLYASPEVFERLERGHFDVEASMTDYDGKASKTRCGSARQATSGRPEAAPC